MFTRILKPSKSQSFFLFGARGSGKSTFVAEQFGKGQSILTLDLLDATLESAFLKNPNSLKKKIEDFKVKNKTLDWVFIDEVQKVPKLLDLVHQLIEKNDIKFILSGSSARKLKRGGANLLAGRAFVYHLFPLTFNELEKKFQLDFQLAWGSLPQIYKYDNDSDRTAFLKSYTLTYIKEEVQMEQLIRHLKPFHLFLEVAAQNSGKVINTTKIGKDIGVDPKTVQSYYQILEETWLGFRLPGLRGSFRKSLRISPKFFLFDVGVKRALEDTLDVKVKAETSSYGQLFEHFLINEIHRFNTYAGDYYKLSYVQTKDEAEIDLVLTKRDQQIAIEIKSSKSIDERKVIKLAQLVKDMKKTRGIFLSQCKDEITIQSIKCMPWQKGIEYLFGEEKIELFESKDQA